MNAIKYHKCFETIPTDLVPLILTFVSASDFANLLQTRKAILCTSHVQARWMFLLATKWGIDYDEISNFSTDKFLDLRLLYPLATKVLNGLVSEKKDYIQCNGNEVFFKANIGEGNLSVTSQECFYSPSNTNARGVIRCFMDVINTACKIFSCSVRKQNPPQIVDKTQFSSPFFVKSRPNKMFISARSVAYYEVKIVRSEKSNNVAGIGDAIECVAVGLATENFLSGKRFPGWDLESYGYHGDDGAIYHGRGRQLSTFGPAFGCNDVVGCGIDFKQKIIFYTLNGLFLGAAFTNIATDHLPLYPTVGIDAAVCVRFNFGATPFEFDLAAYIHD